MSSRLMILIAGLLVQGAAGSAEKDASDSVGRAACAACHADQVALWTDSNHDLAMQRANSKTVLCDSTKASVPHRIESTTDLS